MTEEDGVSRATGKMETSRNNFSFLGYFSIDFFFRLNYEVYAEEYADSEFGHSEEDYEEDGGEEEGDGDEEEDEEAEQKVSENVKVDSR